ncbi:MAG: glutaredoxin family protein [Cellvibrionaceae bacterium]
MKNPIIFACLVLGALYFWQNSNLSSSAPQPLFTEPYVAVYGRDSCSFTQNTLRKLEQKNIKHQYFVVDSRKVADELHLRMQQSGLDTRRYDLPVVDISGQLIIRPSSEQIAQLYRPY